MKFNVLRQHFGDKMYMPGDAREAAETVVQHLVDRGVLAKMEDAASANKAERAAPHNKKDRKRR